MDTYICIYNIGAGQTNQSVKELDLLHLSLDEDRTPM